MAMNFKPATRHELLVRMGIVVDYDEMFYEIFVEIYKAADAGKRTVTYFFPEKATSEQRSQVYIDLGKLGYDTHGVGPDCEKRIIISW